MFSFFVRLGSLGGSPRTELSIGVPARDRPVVPELATSERAGLRGLRMAYAGRNAARNG